jgi:hypothetical protein
MFMAAPEKGLKRWLDCIDADEASEAIRLDKIVPIKHQSALSPPP